MTDSVKELTKKLDEQERQIRLLKQAIMRLEQRLHAVSTVTNRVQGQTRRVTEDVRTIQSKLRKGE